MNAEEYDRAVQNLRDAADALETVENAEVIMPGWDEQYIDDRERRVRVATEAVRARGKAPGECTRVHVRDLGCLVRYVADMMEQTREL